MNQENTPCCGASDFSVPPLSWAIAIAAQFTNIKTATKISSPVRTNCAPNAEQNSLRLSPFCERRKTAAN